AIDFGAATFISSLMNLEFGYSLSKGHVFLTYTVIVALHGLINTFGVRLLARINNIYAWWHMAGVLVVVGVLIVIPDHHKSLSFGFILLVAVTFAIPGNVQDTALQYTFAVQYIWQNAMSTKWAEFLLIIACVAQFFCGLASVTSASRMMFAFSRDRAIPGHQLWRRVSKRERVPVNSVWAICILAWA